MAKFQYPEVYWAIQQYTISSFDINPTGRWPISLLPNSSGRKCCSKNFCFTYQCSKILVNLLLLLVLANITDCSDSILWKLTEVQYHPGHYLQLLSPEKASLCKHTVIQTHIILLFISVQVQILYNVFLVFAECCEALFLWEKATSSRIWKIRGVEKQPASWQDSWNRYSTF